MATVEELKSQAKSLEDSGRALDALVIYDDLLRQFEEDSAAVVDGPSLYVRVGDLRRALGQPARSFAAYQAAAERFAASGSGEDVKKMCVRMINVVPASGDAYVRYARRLFEHGHVDPALDVVREFAKMADIDVVTDAVEKVLERPNSERRALMAGLLDTIARESLAQSKVARRVSRELRESAGMVDEVQHARPVAPSARFRSSPDTSGVRSHEAPVPRVGMTSPSRNRDRQNKSNWPTIGIAFSIVGAVVVGFVIISVVRGGDDGSTASSNTVFAAVDSQPVTNAAPQDDAPTEPVPAVTAAPPSNPPAVDASLDDLADTSTDDTPPDETPIDEAPIVDSAQTESLVLDLMIDQPMVVESLAVQSVEEVVFRGLRGFRVVHLLDASTRFVVETYPVDSAAANSYPVGTIIVNVVPPDTTVSIVRPDDMHLVFASGVVPEDSARVLIGLLRVRQPSN